MSFGLIGIFLPSVVRPASKFETNPTCLSLLYWTRSPCCGIQAVASLSNQDLSGLVLDSHSVETVSAPVELSGGSVAVLLSMDSISVEREALDPEIASVAIMLMEALFATS
jgi:hypothetical protein